MVSVAGIHRSGLAVLLVSLLWAGAQDVPADLVSRIDSIVVELYQAASAGFPCEAKTRGKPKMLRWEDVDRCLNNAAARVDWEASSRRLSELAASFPKVTGNQFATAVEAAVAAHALRYEQLLKVRNPDALLPLTNTLLKYLPAGSLDSLPVTDKQGTEVGTFAGTYAYERTGGLATANTYRLVLFQYKDPSGSMQTAAGKLLLDSFGVPWKSALTQVGFRLPAEKLTLNKY
jgi:hypothetical protein